MSNPYEELSTAYGGSGEVNTDANLSLDTLMLGGIEANDYALKSFVNAMAINILSQAKGYTDQQREIIERELKAYTDNAIASQDFSRFATKADLNAAIANEVARCTNAINIAIANEVTRSNAAIDSAVSAIHIENYVTTATFNSGIGGLQSQINQLFQSVSNGKQSIASAITDKGVQAEATDSFSLLAQKILAIPTSGGGGGTEDATASASDIKIGKTAYARGVKLYGTYYDQTGSVPTSDATANPADIKLGETAYVNGQKLTGTLDVSTGISDISSAVTKIYSTVLDKVALDKTTTIAYDALQTIHPGQKKYVITIAKVSGVYKIYVDVPGLTGANSVRKTYNASDFGVPVDGELTYTVKYIYTDGNCLFVVTHDGSKYEIYVCEIGTSNITVDSGSNYVTVVPKNAKFHTTFVETTREMENRFAIKVMQPGVNGRFAIVGVDFISSGLYNCYMYIKIYNLTYFSVSGSSEGLIQEVDSLRVENDYSFKQSGGSTIPRLEFLNGKLLSIDMGDTWRLVALDASFGTIKGHKVISTSGAKGCVHVNNTGTKAIFINSNKLVRCSITVNYDTGNISVSTDTEYYQDEYFQKNLKLLYGNPEDTYAILLYSDGETWNSKPVYAAVYGLDFNSNEILHYLSGFTNLELGYPNISMPDNARERILSDGTYCFINTGNNLAKFYSIPNYEEVIGLEYEGDTYYNLSRLRLSAGESDVVYGKSFVGADGVKQVGTKVVVE